jgi:hypothetical protein
MSWAQDKKLSPGSYTLKVVSLKNTTLWPGIMNGKIWELVLQIHFLMKKNAKALQFLKPQFVFQTGIKRQNVWGRATFLALITAVRLFFVLFLKHKKMAGIKTKSMKITMFCGIRVHYHSLLSSVM